MKEKTCENCSWFSQHYAKYNTKFHKVFCGHCIHVKNKKMKTIPCEFWDDIENLKAERKKSIKETLVLMSQRLNDIALILKDDND